MYHFNYTNLERRKKFIEEEEVKGTDQSFKSDSKPNIEFGTDVSDLEKIDEEEKKNTRTKEKTRTTYIAKKTKTTASIAEEPRK